MGQYDTIYSCQYHLTICEEFYVIRIGVKLFSIYLAIKFKLGIVSKLRYYPWNIFSDSTLYTIKK